MSNFICKECGAHHYDLDCLGYRTHDDIGLMEDYRKLSKTMLEERENHINDCLMCDKFDFNKRIDELQEILAECKTFFEEENPNDFTVLSERMNELLAKINEVQDVAES